MSAQPICSDKQNLRTAYKALRLALAPAEKARLDRKITDRFLELPQYLACNTLLCYVSAEIEVSTRMILQTALKSGKIVAVPRCVPGTREMEFFCITDFGQLASGAYGILEPDPAQCRKLTDFSGSVCIVPALAYDKAGYRLGFGKGYYDRFLSRFSGQSVGLIYESCFCECLPHGAFDCRAQMIVTESKVISIV